METLGRKWKRKVFRSHIQEFTRKAGLILNSQVIQLLCYHFWSTIFTSITQPRPIWTFFKAYRYLCWRNKTIYCTLPVIKYKRGDRYQSVLEQETFFKDIQFKKVNVL